MDKQEQELMDLYLKKTVKQIGDQIVETAIRQVAEEWWGDLGKPQPYQGQGDAVLLEELQIMRILQMGRKLGKSGLQKEMFKSLMEEENGKEVS